MTLYIFLLSGGVNKRRRPHMAQGRFTVQSRIHNTSPQDILSATSSPLFLSDWRHCSASARYKKKKNGIKKEKKTSAGRSKQRIIFGVALRDVPLTQEQYFLCGDSPAHCTHRHSLPPPSFLSRASCLKVNTASSRVEAVTRGVRPSVTVCGKSTSDELIHSALSRCTAGPLMRSLPPTPP